ncbi:N-acetylmannosamine-6-phosphate 2-epimerase [Lysinibacter cavernae]|uniref:N-acylglucosamine-6-phosphate 2-epimerase n=1 Tax=Lysinibacter cavernae TaxID=1640652 RepID=A0A7X5TU60_9MICO|nr:putative N-acetylmannosamine-6-phosphate 2-epimerase [Lysinibacter cavernae]NIH54038.1 putative N-acetylmannosamine-6-phosphate epimerase [Lysinibacter cavernae]
MSLANSYVESLRGGLVVSCQARADNPLHGPVFMAAMAKAAELGGAVGIRAQGFDDIAAIVDATALPIIGIRKDFAAGDVYITPSLADATIVRDAGAQIIALDATDRPRPGGITAPELIRSIREELALPVMADVDTVSAGLAAAEAGAELIATTLSGYTGGSVPPEADYDLIAALVAEGLTVVAEGRIRDARDVERAFGAGAFSVVVGTAVTNPWRITERLVSGLPPR